MTITDVKTDSLQYTPLPLPKTALIKPNLEAIVFDKWIGVGTGGESIHRKITLKNHSDLDVKISTDAFLMFNEFFYIPSYGVDGSINIYHLEDHPKIVLCDISNQEKISRLFFNLDSVVPSEYQIKHKEYYAVNRKLDRDDMISKISEECYQKKAVVTQLLLSLQDESSAFSQNGVLQEIVILIGKQFAMQYEKILQDQFKTLDNLSNVF